MEGSLVLASMERLRELAPPAGTLSARLHFYRDEGGRPVLAGSFSTELMLVCQRCLETMRLPLQADFQLFLVGDLEQADRLDDRMEVLQVDRRAMSLATILEDEVLLAAPSAPLHPSAQCSAAGMPEQDAADDLPLSQRPNPFAALAALKLKS